MVRGVIYLNGKFADLKNAKVSVLNRAFLYGDGVFETIKAVNNKVLFLKEHINRLYKSASMIGIKPHWKKNYVSEKITQAVKKIDAKEKYVRVMIVRGFSNFKLLSGESIKPELYIISAPYKGIDEKNYEKGVKIKISSIKRNHPDTVNPKIKSLSLLNNILSRLGTKDAFESIMLSVDGYVTEGSISNIFVVKNGKLYTPSVESGILEGIIRKVVIKLAKKIGIPVIEKKMKLAELLNCDECFITNSLIGILPVKMINNKRIKKPLNLTNLLRRKYMGIIEGSVN